MEHICAHCGHRFEDDGETTRLCSRCEPVYGGETAEESWAAHREDVMRSWHDEERFSLIRGGFADHPFRPAPSDSDRCLTCQERGLAAELRKDRHVPAIYTRWESLSSAERVQHAAAMQPAYIRGFRQGQAAAKERLDGYLRVLRAAGYVDHAYWSQIETGAGGRKTVATCCALPRTRHIQAILEEAHAPVARDRSYGDFYDGLPGAGAVLPLRVADALIRAGYTTRASIAAARDYELRRIKGVGPIALRAIRRIAPRADA